MWVVCKTWADPEKPSGQEFLDAFAEQPAQYHLRQLCTSPLNRKGLHLFGSRVLTLGETWHKGGKGQPGGEKFQLYRYNYAIGHDNDPNDPTRGSVFTNKMAAIDSRLQDVDPSTVVLNLASKNHMCQALHGIMRHKLHVGMTATGFVPGEFSEQITASSSQPDLVDAVTKGIWVRRIPYAAVQKFPEAFEQLMRSDNIDHETGLSEDEMSDLFDVYDLRAQIRSGAIKQEAGESELDTIRRLVMDQAGKITDEGLLVGRYNISKVSHYFEFK